ncbi:12780_t:CDS:2 [Entrophospora sp. SA101]|nr:12780_t:CDS:2 [Entrophospora sp. SA101]
MVTCLHQTFYRSNATQLSESDIKEIRDSRGKIPNASKKMAEKFHIGACRVYEIWEYTERLQQGLDHVSFSADESQNIEASVIESEDLDALYEKEARRDEKNKANMTHLLATT